MIRLKELTLLVLIFQLASCIRRNDSGCDMISSSEQTCIGNKLADCYLSDSSLNYIDTNSAGFTLNNKVGYPFNFAILSRNKAPAKQDLIRKSYEKQEYCQLNKYTCFDYAKTENEEVHFYNSKLALEIIYRRQSKIVKYELDSERIKNFNGSDVISIVLKTIGSAGSKEFYLPFNGFNYGKSFFRDTLSVNGKAYQNVYCSCIDTPLSVPDLIVPAGVYYTLEKRLIGYYLSNGETFNLP